jgi:aryl-alcohol dehydrogenase-like predicted oxidoreductase
MTREGKLRRLVIRPNIGPQPRDSFIYARVASSDGLSEEEDQGDTFDSSDFRNVVPRFTPEARKSNHALVDLLREIAGQKKATPAQIALAWLLARKSWIVPIPGTTKPARLEENIGAETIKLTSEDLREIDSAGSQITVEGARYPEQLQRLVGR